MWSHSPPRYHTLRHPDVERRRLPLGAAAMRYCCSWLLGRIAFQEWAASKSSHRCLSGLRGDTSSLKCNHDHSRKRPSRVDTPSRNGTQAITARGASLHRFRDPGRKVRTQQAHDIHDQQDHQTRPSVVPLYTSISFRTHSCYRHSSCLSCGRYS